VGFIYAKDGIFIPDTINSARGNIKRQGLPSKRARVRFIYAKDGIFLEGLRQRLQETGYEALL
jgi:hypothetical protein